MSGRPVISYDDITLPYDSQANEAAPPPAKKAKTNNQHHHNGNGNGCAIGSSGRQHAHWDDPSASSTGVKSQPGHGGAGAGKKGNNNKKAGGNAKGNSAKAKQKSKATANFSVNMSRELTHEEIWDDSALVEAWDAAMEEYEAFNGPGKGWKEGGPVVKSALWYNTPVKKDASTNEDEGEYDADEAYVDGEEDDYALEDPLDEGELAELDDSAGASTQQPTWPGPNAAPAPAYDISGGPGASLSTVSQDEAFSRALNAMYWGGYWTAVYHCHRAQGNPTPAVAAGSTEDEKVDANGVEDEGEPERDEDASSDNMNTA